MSQQPKVTEFTIDRSKWGRGFWFWTASKLLNSETGKMCCLGFFGLACGLTPEQIKGESAPDRGLEKHRQAWRDREAASWLFNENGRSADCSDLMTYNDLLNYKSEAIREDDIARTFAKNGVTVTFIDGT